MDSFEHSLATCPPYFVYVCGKAIATCDINAGRAEGEGPDPLPSSWIHPCMRCSNGKMTKYVRFIPQRTVNGELVPPSH